MIFFFSLIFLTIIGNICWLFKFDKWILAFLLIIIPAIIEFTLNKDKIFFFSKFRSNSFNIINLVTIFLIIVASLISIIIHAVPSLINEYPLGFDTYQLHIIRINYFLKDGKVVLGDLVTGDFLNPLRYQWGFHVFAGSIGLLIEQNSIFLLRVLPLISGLILPIAIYTACPLFGLNTKNGRILVCLISPLFFHDPGLLGLIYPFPSSMSLIIFIISFRLLYEIYRGDRKLISFYFILIPFAFYFYKGLGIILFLTFLIFVPLSKFNKLNKVKSKKILLLFYCLIISFLGVISLNFVNQMIENEFNLISIFSFEISIFQLNKIVGQISLFIFIFSLIFVLYSSIFKKDNSNFLLLLIFILLLILSSGFFMGSRWLLYLAPIIVFFNSKFLTKFFNIIETEIVKFRRLKSIKIPIRIAMTILLVSILTDEPISHNLYPSHALNPEFGDLEESIYNQIEDLENNSVVLSTYTMYKFYSLYSIGKNTLYLSEKKVLNYYYLARGGYPLVGRYNTNEEGGSLKILDDLNKSKILDLNDTSSDNSVSFSEYFTRRTWGEITFSFKKNTFDNGKIKLYSNSGQELFLKVHYKDNTLQCETIDNLIDIANISINKWYDLRIKFDILRNPQYEIYINSTLVFSNNFSKGANTLGKIEFSTISNDYNYHFYVKAPTYSWIGDLSEYWHKNYGNNRFIYFTYIKSDFWREWDNLLFFSGIIPNFNITYIEDKFAILRL